MPPSQSRSEDDWDAWSERRLSIWVRGGLVLMAIGLISVLVIAVGLDPYEADGTPRAMGTHQQLGMPPCTFVLRTGKPCPSCGLTTSFSLFMHGDVMGSMRTNWVGTVMVLFIFALVPWVAWCVVRKRLVGIRSLELGALAVMGVFAVLLLLRWGVVMWLLRGA